MMIMLTMMGALVLRREQVRLHNDSIKIGERGITYFTALYITLYGKS